MINAYLGKLVGEDMVMSKEGKYIYCIIGANEGRNFGTIGIGQRGDVVTTIGYNDISAVISNSPLTRYVINRENLMDHERVIEEVMRDYTVLPVRFCTVANNAEEVRMFLRKRYVEFKGLLRDLDNKVEVGLKARWTQMKTIFAEIMASGLEMKGSLTPLAGACEEADSEKRVALGRAVKDALEKRKREECEKVLNTLKRIAIDIQAKDGVGDEMFLNAVFLIDRTREKQFDFLVEDLAEKYSGTADFQVVGPAPPFNFVNLEMKL